MKFDGLGCVSSSLALLAGPLLYLHFYIRSSLPIFHARNENLPKYSQSLLVFSFPIQIFVPKESLIAIHIKYQSIIQTHEKFVLLEN